MASERPAEPPRWRRRVLLAAITVVIVSLTYHATCALVFGCGCSWFFAGGTDTCDIHVAGPPDCPVCTNVAVGIAFSAALLAAWGTVVGLVAGRLRTRPS
jgi:hypothetical protein